MRREQKRRPKASKRKRSLQLQSLEQRELFAADGLTNLAVLDFDGEYMSDTQLQRGRWSTSDFENSSNGVSFPSFNSLFNASRSWLDLTGDGRVNSYDARAAVDWVVDKVMQDFSPYDLDIVVGDQDTYAHTMTDTNFTGNVTVVISGGEDTTVDRFGNPQSSLGWSYVDEGNEKNDYAFVFAGQSVDSFGNSAFRWLNQVARTISHEMGHGFGLEHEVEDLYRSTTGDVTHSTMGTVNRDWGRDFAFQDIYNRTDDGSIQNAHQYLSRSDVLGESKESWMAVLKPGQLTVHAGDNAHNDSISIYDVGTSQWRVNHNGQSTLVGLQSSGIESLNPFGEDLSRINVYGEGGDDYIYLSMYSSATLFAFGGSGNDRIYGGLGADQLYGNDGNDYLSGRGGNDLVFGHNGNDEIYGGSGDDSLVGGNGHDRLYGSDGNDLLQGNSGNDVVWGGDGNDRLFGSDGIDWLYGNDGNDFLDGGADGLADILYGGSGTDQFKQERYFDWSSFRYKNRDQPRDLRFFDLDRVV